MADGGATVNCRYRYPADTDERIAWVVTQGDADLAAERDICDALAEAAAGLLIDVDGQDDCGDPECGDCQPWRPLRAALDAYHTHREGQQ
jgi:hypothetical protein